MSSKLIALKRNWPGPFRRTIRCGKKGKEQTTLLEFAPGEPVAVTEEQFAALAPEIGTALFEVFRDANGALRYSSDGTVPEAAATTNTPDEIPAA